MVMGMLIKKERQRDDVYTCVSQPHVNWVLLNFGGPLKSQKWV